jgi:hypothetical protein
VKGIADYTKKIFVVPDQGIGTMVVRLQHLEVALFVCQ